MYMKVKPEIINGSKVHGMAVSPLLYMAKAAARSWYCHVQLQYCMCQYCVSVFAVHDDNCNEVQSPYY